MDAASALPVYIAKKSRLRTRIWKHKWIYLLLVLPFFATLIFNYFPMYGIIISFKDYRVAKGILGSNWANPWYKYYWAMFKDITFFSSVLNTVTISFTKLILNTASCIMLALLLNEVRHTIFKRTVQTITYLPHFLSWIVMASVITTMFSASWGAITVAVQKMTGFQYNPMSNPGLYRSLLYVSTLYKEVGFGSIIYLAAIAGVNPELYEAATIDGANRFQRVWHITLTSIRSIIVLLLILAVGGLMNGNFDQIINTYTPTVLSTGDIIDTWIYRHGIKNVEYSFTAAAGMFKQVVNIMLLLVVNNVAKLFGEEGVI